MVFMQSAVAEEDDDEEEALRRPADITDDPTKVDRKPQTNDDGSAAKRVRVQSSARNMVIRQWWLGVHNW